MPLDYVPEVTASLGVKSLDAAIDWYQSVLGFTLLYRADEIGWCELATAVPGVNVGLSQNESVAQGGGLKAPRATPARSRTQSAPVARPSSRPSPE